MTLSTLPLSYCTNVHPGRTVAEVVEGISSHSAMAQRLIDFPMAAGLWLSASVAEELSDGPDRLELLAQTLWQHDLCCYTLNTFPFGDFHSDRVKEQVYLPDWTDPRRMTYTEQCASVLSQLIPEGGEGSLSTVPLGGQMNPHAPDFHAVCFHHLIRFARFLKHLHDTTGRKIRLGLEPEPLCELSGTERWTLPIMRQLFRQAEALGCEELVRDYIGLCFDVCHQAVEFEDVSRSIDQIVSAGIRINKVHITNAVELRNPAVNTPGLDALKQFAEPRYLHQTFARFSDGTVESRLDLLVTDLEGPKTERFFSANTWRVHFHVPIFAEQLGPLFTTRPDLARALRRISRLDYAPHLEVETYTWPVMPGTAEDDSSSDLATRIARELQSASELLGQSDDSQ